MDTPEGRIGKTHGSSEINPRDRLGLMDVPYFLMENDGHGFSIKK